ncbi:MAG TPA: type II CAAX endopeptidase family protein [Turneriella sp.]|nr:type II CAAX endopeptidase family protein [Turneriella sp.]HMY10867.1 type II CAAX endopeptidase family protein [Turneriella sp.]HNL11378.1 type II CAAX endopeptidase family protein [Turneriella sp.]HNL54584.1 type II CAAX endopeptidase family protein [Turneriella sp.]HNN01216.1 type II CAAX endopeptidase family protein [Turneriella sp.]
MVQTRPLWQRYLAVVAYLLLGFLIVQALATVTAGLTGIAENQGKMPFRSLLFALVIQMVGFLLPAPLLLRFTRAGNFGFARASAGDVLLACGLTFASLVVFSLLYHALGIQPQQLAFLDQREILHHRQAFLIMTAVVVPAYEEWIFRGVIFGVLVTQYENRRSVFTAGIFTALLFTASHIEGKHSYSALPPIFAMALIFHYMTWRSGSIWPAVTAHAMQNLLSATALIAKAGEQSR